MLRLDDRYRLISYGKVLVLYDNASQAEYELDSSQFDFLHLLDGTREREGLLDILATEDRSVGEEMLESLQELDALQETSENCETRVFPESFDPYLESITIDITSQCNLRCRHCYVGDFLGAGKGSDLTTEQWKRVIDDIAAMNVRSIGITGGEPTVREDICELVDYVLSKNIPVASFFTNGLIVDDAWVEYLSNLRYPTNIYTSLDGHTPELHTIIRQREDAFERAVESIKKLCKAGMRVNINTSVNSANLKQLPEMYEFVKGLGTYRWRLAVPKPLGRFPECRDELLPEWQQLQDVFMEIIDRNLSEIHEMDGELQAPMKLEIELLFRTEMVSRQINEFDKDTLVCLYHRDRCAIKANGDVLSCAYFDDKPLGNVTEMPLPEIWTSAEMRDFKKIKVKDIPACSDCEYLRICGSGCRAIAYSNTGSMYREDEYACSQVPIFDGIVKNMEKYGFPVSFRSNPDGVLRTN